jgi:hypothetical protein
MLKLVRSAMARRLWSPAGSSATASRAERSGSLLTAGAEVHGLNWGWPPQVTVDHKALFVRDGNLFTAAGMAAGIDLALGVVEDDLGAAVARTAAKVLVVFLQRPGTS